MFTWETHLPFTNPNLPGLLKTQKSRVHHHQSLFHFPGYQSNTDVEIAEQIYASGEKQHQVSAATAIAKGSKMETTLGDQEPHPPALWPEGRRCYLPLLKLDHCAVAGVDVHIGQADE